MNPVIYYSEAKDSLGAALNASEEVLHLHAGLLIFFVAALLFGRRMRSRMPIALVYLFAVANEVIDALGPDLATGSWDLVTDIASTVAWPTLIFLLARRHGEGNETPAFRHAQAHEHQQDQWGPATGRIRARRSLAG